MSVTTIEAEKRETGKRASRQVRRSGNVPCVLYSRSTEPVHFQMPALQLKRLAFTRRTSRIEVNVGGESWSCVLKDIVLHPITDEPRHADFQVLQAGERITLTVPVRFQGVPVGQTEGGDTQVILNEVEVSCLPQDIPTHIEVDIAALDIGDSIHIYDLEVEGVEFEMNPEQTVVTVVAPYVEPDPEELEETLLGEEAMAEEGELADTAEAADGAEATGAEGDEDFDEDL